MSIETRERAIAAWGPGGVGITGAYGQCRYAFRRYNAGRSLYTYPRRWFARIRIVTPTHVPAL